MKAIILSAGQGRRLLPLTRQTPKCLLPVNGSRCVLEEQLRALAACGIPRAVVMVGFGAEHVERTLPRIRPAGIEVTTRFNPLSAQTDNLFTAWLAEPAMDEDFLFLNGDTLFDRSIPERLLARGTSPLNIALARKRRYDDDDMKVLLRPDGTVRAIGKKLGVERPDAEAIGMTLVRERGVAAFRRALDAAVRDPEALSAWYTSVLHELADQLPVRGVGIGDAWWTEIDSRADLDTARTAYRERATPPREVRLPAGT